jgi:hypothetical protein
MPVIATDTTRFSAVVKHEYEPSIGTTREMAVVNDAAATWKVGAVVGKVTATGKYKLVEATAVDGSQNAAGVYIADALGNSGDVAIPANTDAKVLILARGPARVAKDLLTFGATVDTQPEKDALYAQLAALGITCDTAI